MAAVRMNDGETIALDGRFDEAVWKRAVPAADFIQRDPDNGKPATEPTEVRIVYSRNALYLGVTCFDSEPDKLIGYQRRRDEFLQSDDKFQWVIDTYLDARSAYSFEMNPSGLMADEIRGVGTNNRQWDGIWNAKVLRSEIGWTLEIEIPFRTLNFKADSDTWGINFARTVQRKNEETLWMGWPRNQGLNRMTNAGLLTGIRDVSQGPGLDIKPYGVTNTQSSPGRGDSKTKTDASAGVDLFYNPTPGLRANLTINTDFAQTEVDQRLVNLTRFPLFFPERRDFFLDGSTFLDFGTGGFFGGGGGFGFGGGGGQNNLLLPFFSRRIGLDANGNPQKIDVGGKLTGQVGREDIGVLQVRTGRENAAAGEDFTVLRLKHRMLRQSYVGALYTKRHTRESVAPDLDTVGLDFRFQTSTFLGKQNLQASGFYLNTTNPLNTGQSAAYGFQAEYPNDLWFGEFQYREVQKNYNAAVGFAQRTGYRRMNPMLQVSPRPAHSRWFRRFSFRAGASLLMDPADNRLLNRDWDFTVFQVEMHSQDFVQVHVLPTYERLNSNFTLNISPGKSITLPVGNEYSFTRYRIDAQTANRRVIAVQPSIEGGSFYSGDRRRVALNVAVRARPGVIVYVGGEWNRVHLAEGSFQTRVFRLVPELQFSPWISVVNNIQYDSVSAVVGWQSRFRWILKPGNDLYVVYTHNWLDDPLLNGFSTLDRRLASKILYTHRF